MTDTRPMYLADWHARRAEDLTDLARSASMSGWLKRGHRPDMLAAAQNHAILGAIAMKVEPGELNGQILREHLDSTQESLDQCRVRSRQLQDELGQIQRTLANYGLTVGDVLDVARGVERLLEDRYAGDPNSEVTR